MFSPVRSLNLNTCAELFTNTDMVAFHPLDTKARAGHALDEFIDDVGVPETLIFDNSKEQSARGSDFMKTVRRNHIN